MPYPFAAYDHQVTNAQNLAERGGAVMIKDAELTGERLAHEIERLLKDRAHARPHVGERAPLRAARRGRAHRAEPHRVGAHPKRGHGTPTPDARRRGGRLMYGRPRAIHFIGIGGSGMSGLAEVLLTTGLPRVGLGPQGQRRHATAW